MNCETIKDGTECAFMSKKGCGFNGGTCYEITENCQGCDRSKEYKTGWYCASVPDPKIKWRRDDCNLATHVSAKAKEKQQKVNPLKASKRAAR